MHSTEIAYGFTRAVPPPRHAHHHQVLPAYHPTPPYAMPGTDIAYVDRVLKQTTLGHVRY
eukprot:3940584-Rhodomonas_salina.2